MGVSGVAGVAGVVGGAAGGGGDSVIGSGGGVVAIVQPIQARIPRRMTTARKAVISSIMVGQK